MANIKKIALIGIGYWGKVHLKYLKKIRSLEIKKIYYKSKKPNLKNKLINNLLTNNIDEIKNDPTINYVDIVSPIKTHTRILLKLINKKRDVLIEKPLLMNKNEELKIDRLINLKNKIIVSYPYVYSKTLKFAKKQIESNVYGKLLYIEVTIQQCGRFLEYNVNELLGPHALSIISIFYEIDKLQFIKENILFMKNKCETSIIFCKKNNKTVAMINLSLNYANNKNLKIIKFFLENGTINIDLNRKKNTYESFLYKRNNIFSKIKKHKVRKFNENDNMKYVIGDFVNNKDINIKENFKLTKIINKFIQS